jgi:hypothetical protein
LCKICFIIIHTFHTLISCIGNTFERWIFWKMQNLCDIHSFISTYFIHQQIYLCVKRVFNSWYSCEKCMKLWMNELCTIFIINWSHAKFVMYAFNKVIHWNIASAVCLFVYFCYFQPLLKILNTYTIKCLFIITNFSPNLV